MKCPKCGYNSFDYLDSCKKCNKDLTEHKARFNIHSIPLSEMPAEAISSVAEEVVAVATASGDIAIDDFAGGGATEDADDFGFDFMGDTEDDENLAFDELFEEVPSEDDVEETLPAPETAAKAAADVPNEDFAVEEDDADDFGYDFMGDSKDSENPAFDELFEDVSSEDDVEEALPAPETAVEPVPLDQELAAEEDTLELKESVSDDFSFDETEPSKEAAAIIPDSPPEFGFDADEDPAADIFAETEEDFSLDGIDFEDSDKA